jgi:hypothetical protein
MAQVHYLQQKELEARREAHARSLRVNHACHGQQLQQRANAQREHAAEAEREMAERKQAAASAAKEQAKARRAEATQRDAMYVGYSKWVHDVVQEGHAHVEHAKAAVAHHNAAVGSTLREAKGALEQRSAQLKAAREAEARMARDRVKASTMVMVTPEVAAQIARREGRTALKPGGGSDAPSSSVSS